MLYGHFRGLSQFYADGLERMEIVINRRHAALLPYRHNIRVPITLKIGNEQYEAGLRSTPNMPVVWISPDLKDSHGKKISLARVIRNNGFTKNQQVFLEIAEEFLILRSPKANLPCGSTSGKRKGVGNTA